MAGLLGAGKLKALRTTLAMASPANPASIRTVGARKPLLQPMAPQLREGLPDAGPDRAFRLRPAARTKGPKIPKTALPKPRRS